MSTDTTTKDTASPYELVLGDLHEARAKIDELENQIHDLQMVARFCKYAALGINDRDDCSKFYAAENKRIPATLAAVLQVKEHSECLTTFLKSFKR